MQNQLGLFENEQCEFIYPEGLYTERVMSLESALRGRSPAGLPASVYYMSNREDEEMVSSPCVVKSFIPEENSTSDPHMTGSGFGVDRLAAQIDDPQGDP